MPSAPSRSSSDRSERSSLRVELESLKKEVLTDPSRAWEPALRGDLRRSAFRELEVNGTAFGLLILDIDYFKAANDEHGHAIGDRVLRMIGWTLANAVRRNDAAIRWGGEEFVVICPRIQLPVLEEVAERGGP